MPLFVKICGLAREEDLRHAASLHPDALGFVFWPASPRAVTADQVRDWTRGLDGPLKVGVFVDAGEAAIREIRETAGLDVVQLHGDEDAAFCRAVGGRVWKALRIPEHAERAAEFPVEALLVDSGTRDQPGGTGRTVDWDAAGTFVRAAPLPVLLAGGLSPDNVEAAVRRVAPWGVDVSSGVECEPGRKNPDAVRAFIEAARAAGPTA